MACCPKGGADKFASGDHIHLKPSYAPIAVAVVALSSFGCGKKGPDSSGLSASGSGVEEGAAIATVNGQAITAKDYYDYLVRKSTVDVAGQQGVQSAQTVGSVGLQALRDLINNQMILQLAKDQGVAPTDADIKKELDMRIASTPDLMARAQKAGLTQEGINDLIRMELARDNILSKGVTVPPAEVDQYIKENPKDFVEPATVHLLVIMAKDAAKKAAIDKDLATMQFRAVAKKDSDAPDAKTTEGVVRETRVSALSKPLQDLVAKTAAGKATDWVNDNGGAFKFFVESKTPEKPLVMDAPKKAALQRQLAVRRGQNTNDIQKMLIAKFGSSSISVSLPVLQAPWQSMADEMKREAAAAASMPPGGVSGVPGGPGAPGAPGGTTVMPTPGKGSAPATGAPTPGKAPK